MSHACDGLPPYDRWMHLYNTSTRTSLDTYELPPYGTMAVWDTRTRTGQRTRLVRVSFRALLISFPSR
eukprot:scaffold98255_cov37-Prasinocladus_malaysianus.AAC.1